MSGIVVYGIKSFWKGRPGRVGAVCSQAKVVDHQLISPEVSKSLCVLGALLFPPFLEL